MKTNTTFLHQKAWTLFRKDFNNSPTMVPVVVATTRPRIKPHTTIRRLGSTNRPISILFNLRFSNSLAHVHNTLHSHQHRRSANISHFRHSVWSISATYTLYTLRGIDGIGVFSWEEAHLGARKIPFHIILHNLEHFPVTCAVCGWESCPSEGNSCLINFDWYRVLGSLYIVNYGIICDICNTSEPWYAFSKEF